MTGAGNGARSGALTSPTSAAGKADLGKFLDAYLSSLASDLDGAPVFTASSAFSLRFKQEPLAEDRLCRREGLSEGGGVNSRAVSRTIRQTSSPIDRIGNAERAQRNSARRRTGLGDRGARRQTRS
jgi:hypothetical protein